jgi:hypothetical protein
MCGRPLKPGKTTGYLFFVAWITRVIMRDVVNTAPETMGRPLNLVDQQDVSYFFVACKTRLMMRTTTKENTMKEFYENLKREAQENPILALGIAAGLLTGMSKLIDASGHAVGSRAYARQIDHKIKRSPKY